jgi:colicin import membrane protein
MRQDLLKYLLPALGLHVAVAALLTVSLSGMPTPRAIELPADDQQPIQAIAVSEAEVMREVDRQRQQEADARAAEQRRQRELEAQQEAARKNREQEEKRLADLSRQRQEAEKQQKAEQQRLTQLREQQAKEQAELKRIEAEKAVAETARKQEQAQLAKERQAREAAEKKRLEEERKAAEAEKQRKAAEDKRRQEEEARKKAEADKRRAEEEQLQKKLAEEARARDLQRRIGQAAVTFQGAVKGAVTRAWLRPSGTPRGLQSTVVITLALDGRVLNVRTTKSSGNAAFDRSAEIAIQKASPLPMPADPDVAREFQRQGIAFTFNPDA